MARPRQPLAVVQANGKKHLTKQEIAEREEQEVQPCTDEIEAPKYLTVAQRKLFDKLAGQLQKIKIMGETDVDALARYVIAQGLYEQVVKDLRAAQKQQPKGAEVTAGALANWAAMMNLLDKRQDRYFKQLHTAATALGLTISSRCKLVVPVKDEPEKVNKFAKFKKGGQK
jgi:P27 family predicted phage terminase small subunit